MKEEKEIFFFLETLKNHSNTKFNIDRLIIYFCELIIHFAIIRWRFYVIIVIMKSCTDYDLFPHSRYLCVFVFVTNNATWRAVIYQRNTRHATTITHNYYSFLSLSSLSILCNPPFCKKTWTFDDLWQINEGKGKTKSKIISDADKIHFILWFD